MSIKVAKADLERYIQALKDRVEATNREYDETVVPKLKHAEEKRAAEQAAKDEEEAEARRTIEDLL